MNRFDFVDDFPRAIPAILPSPDDCGMEQCFYDLAVQKKSISPIYPLRRSDKYDDDIERIFDSALVLKSLLPHLSGKLSIDFFAQGPSFSFLSNQLTTTITCQNYNISCKIIPETALINSDLCDSDALCRFVRNGILYCVVCVLVRSAG